MGCGPSDASDGDGDGAGQKANKPAAPPPPETKGVPITIADFPQEDVKILTLGAGECGKSTIWRQLKLGYCGGFSDDEREAYKGIIRINVLTDIKVLLECLHRNDQSVASELQSNVDMIADLQDLDEELVPDVAVAISQVWKDPILKHMYQQANSIGLGDNADWFLDNVERIANPNYQPTNEDILKSRIRTNGIDSLKFLMKDKKTVLVDVGGQKSERDRWQRCFQGVDFLMFVVSLSDFDQTMFEVEGASRTQDSMNLFAQIANTNIFESKPIFLILNKVDIFERKFKANPNAFRDAYPGYQGADGDVNFAIKHVSETFLRQLDSDRNQEVAWVKCIPTCAMSEQSVKDLFQTIGEEVVKYQPE